MTNIAQSIVGFRPQDRPEDDFYPTPKHATDALLAKVMFSDPVWEPACGDGAISRALIAKGYEVISTDLYDHGYGETGIDYLTQFYPRAPSVVTNPPFKYAENFVARSLDIGIKQTALFLKLSFLEGVKRSRYLEKTPLKRVMVFRKRVTLVRNGEKPTGGGMIAFAWFYWELGYTGKPEIEWI